jgi:hypothetical protein
MSFFDSLPQPPPPEPVRSPSRPPWMRSETVIPGSVPAEVIVVRTEQVAVAVGSVRAYPNGFEFTVHVRMRREDETAWPGAGDPFDRQQRDPQGREDPLRLGILYADGRRTATTSRRWPLGDDTDNGDLILHSGGGGGGGRNWDSEFWVHPLPPPGPVTLIISWLKYGIGEASTELDGGAIAEAATRAVVLWPQDPDFESSTSWRSGTITATRADPPDPTGPAQAEPET